MFDEYKGFSIFSNVLWWLTLWVLNKWSGSNIHAELIWNHKLGLAAECKGKNVSFSPRLLLYQLKGISDSVQYIG